MTQQDKGSKPDKSLDVAVRTPSGASAAFTFGHNTKVAEATRVSVDHFVDNGEMTDGDYGLALARDGQAIELDPKDQLDEVGVIDGDVLHIINKKPQVDG
jgi:hypothetical protein